MNGVSVSDGIELGILIGFDGQLKQDSKVEQYILGALIEQLYNYRYGYDNDSKHGMIMALIWLYVKTWNAYGAHIIEYKKYVSTETRRYIDNYDDDDDDDEDLWTFDDKDMNAALVTMAYPKKREIRIEDRRTMEQAEELKEMILERFDNDFQKYYEWSLVIRGEMVKLFLPKSESRYSAIP